MVTPAPQVEWRTASRGRSAGGRQCAAQRSRWRLRSGRLRHARVARRAAAIRRERQAGRNPGDRRSPAEPVPVIARTPAVRQAAPSVAQKNMQAAVVAQPATLPGQQDPEAIHRGRTGLFAATVRRLARQDRHHRCAGLSARPRRLRHARAVHAGGRAAVGPHVRRRALCGRASVDHLPAGARFTAGDLLHRRARDGAGRNAHRRRPRRARRRPDRLAAGDRHGSVAGGRLGSLVRIAGGMPLRRDMLKSASAVAIGQTVRVVAAGDGFSISAEGSVMNNASPGQQVRVKTANGQVISDRQGRRDRGDPVVNRLGRPAPHAQPAVAAASAQAVTKGSDCVGNRPGAGAIALKF